MVFEGACADVSAEAVRSLAALRAGALLRKRRFDRPLRLRSRSAAMRAVGGRHGGSAGGKLFAGGWRPTSVLEAGTERVRAGAPRLRPEGAFGLGKKKRSPANSSDDLVFHGGRYKI